MPRVSSKVERTFRGARERIDQKRLTRDLDELIAVLKRATGAWHTVESTITRMKLDQSIAKSERKFLITILRHTAEEERSGLRFSRQLLTGTLQDSGLVDVVSENAPVIAPHLRWASLPQVDSFILRAAGLRDEEILRVVDEGISAYRSEIVQTRVVDLSVERFVRLDGLLGRLEGISPGKWRSDVLQSESLSRLFWDGVKILAGSVVIGADLGGAVPTVGASVLSVAAGVGAIADGARDLESDYREARTTRSTA